MNPGESPAEFENRLRGEAMSWLAARTNDGLDYLTRDDVLDFQIDGGGFRLQPTQNGIHKPTSFEAALSIQTVFHKPGKKGPYDDAVGLDGVTRYKWQGANYDSWDN